MTKLLQNEVFNTTGFTCVGIFMLAGPNGETRQIVGEFRLKNLSQVDGGRIIVETNEKGVPNERSGSILSSYLSDLAENSTFAPLNIPRWDNELFVQRKNNMIKDVEEKFVYPSETKQLTRDWVLMTVCKRWRAYKSRLKQKYFKRKEKSLQEIISNVPIGVNVHQWETLVGMWCQDSHMKLCEKNTVQSNKRIHTQPGEKAMPGYKKRWKSKGKHRSTRLTFAMKLIRKKMAINTSDNVKTIMDAANEELKKRKMDHNGSLSTNDYSEAFKGALAEKAKLRGYYDEKYWSGVNVSQGITFVGKSDQDNLQFEVRMVKDNVEDVKDDVKDVKDDVKDVKGDVKDVKGDVGDVRGQIAMIAAFLAKKFPGESLRNEVDSPTENYEVSIRNLVINVQR
ncbi:uncharacterized protein [Triticum aestivum]|uniref:uncharacterized protein n=1 Tax=Triticum aestivum TaxID=4565 RepID=UPI001D031A6A|nr:uncharacterized protein LOC123152871 [Triticum aestivum]